MRRAAPLLAVIGLALSLPILAAPSLGCWLAMGSPGAICNLIGIAFLPGVGCLALAAWIGLRGPPRLGRAMPECPGCHRPLVVRDRSCTRCGWWISTDELEGLSGNRPG